MAYISSQVGPYAFFAVDKANGTEVPSKSTVYVNDGAATAKGVKSIHAGLYTTTPYPVKHVWTNDSDTLRLVYPTQTVVMDLYNGAGYNQGDYNAGGSQQLDLHFTMNGSNAYLPQGWQGKISFWQGGTFYGLVPNMTDPPTNSTDPYGMGYFGTYESSNHQSANSTGYQLWSTGTGYQMAPQRSGFNPASYGAGSGNASWHPGTNNGVLPYYPDHPSMTKTYSPHLTTFINTDGTPFSFNYHHAYTSLPNDWIGMRWVWDGERSKGDQLRVQELRTLRMAVTSTTDIVPTYG